jgi:hypothetical protein
MKNITLFVLFLAISVYGQQHPMSKNSTIILKGKIIEATTQQPLEYATIVLTHLKRKKITGGVTDHNGNFMLEIPKGLYAICRNIERSGNNSRKIYCRNPFG